MDESHAIQFVYTPKHSSWLNQIEIWFSIISRKILNKRASFSSIEELEAKIKKFINFYNQFLAKPFKWTYSGKLLCK
jgi:transposase